MHSPVGLGLLSHVAAHKPPSGSPPDLSREEKGEGGDRGDLVEKKESPKGDLLLLSPYRFSLLLSPSLHEMFPW